MNVQPPRRFPRIPCFLLCLWFGSVPSQLRSQAVQTMLMQRKYDVRELALTGPDDGVAVGEAHWNREAHRMQSTLLRTEDGGATWKPVPTEVQEDLNDVSFPDALHGFAGGASGLVLRTTDGGLTWESVDNPMGEEIMSLHFSDPSTGWAVANEAIHINPFDEIDAWQSHVWYTGDGGTTWTEQALPEGAGLIHKIWFRTPTEGWAVGQKNLSLDFMAEGQCAAYRTTDGGAHWTEAYSPAIDFVFTDVCFPDDQHGFLVGFAGNSGEDGGNLFRTRDGGATWERIAESGILWEVEFADALRGYAVGHYPGAAWGPPVYRTLDGGDTWETIRMELHSGQGLRGLHVSADKVLALGDDGYLVRSTDPWGAYDEWAPELLFGQEMIDTLYRWEDIEFVNAGTGWVAGQMSAGPESWAQVILHTTDGGQTWQQQYRFHSPVWMAEAQRIDALQFLDEDLGWATGHSIDIGEAMTSGLLRTRDGGATWEEMGAGITEGELVDLHFLNASDGWVLSAAQSVEGTIRLLKTDDGGDTWDWVDTGIEGYVTIGYAVKSGRVVFRNSEEGWVLGAQCDLMKTVDGGDSWERVDLPDDWINTMDLALAGDRKMTICGETQYHSSDRGATWEEVPVAQLHFTDLHFADSLDGWMVGEYGSIYYTTDGGGSWKQAEHEGPGVAWKAISFPPEGGPWVCGLGGVVARLDTALLREAGGGGEVDAAVFPRDPEREFFNYPNPFRDFTEIVFHTDRSGQTDLAVFDLNGRLRRVLIRERLDAGEHRVEFDARDDSGLPLLPGVYVCRLRTPDGSRSLSLMVEKNRNP
ncbi:MAG: YCF48-related protein [Bacteroidales bacterium]